MLGNASLTLAISRLQKDATDSMISLLLHVPAFSPGQKESFTPSSVSICLEHRTSGTELHKIGPKKAANKGFILKTKKQTQCVAAKSTTKIVQKQT